MKVNLATIAQAVLISLLTASIPALITVWADCRSLKADLAATRADLKETRALLDDMRISVGILAKRERRAHPDREYLPLGDK
jgi:hypothetical protein